MNRLKYQESPVVFACQGDALLGIVAAPTPAARETGVLMVVGGPQYRVGSHRQFLLLARRLAEEGWAAMRFDYCGMGDSEGEPRSFEDIDGDIAAAIDAFVHEVPQLRRIVLWGLCDAASATLMYWERTRDPRLAGLCLLNPWLHSEVGLARTRVRHYYARRLFSRNFWGKLVRGGLRWADTLTDLRRNWKLARRKPVIAENYQSLMMAGLRSFAGPVLLILSSRDHTALEFLDAMGADREGRRLLAKPEVTRIDLAQADHTFSSAAWRRQVETSVVEWMATIGGSRAA